MTIDTNHLEMRSSSTFYLFYLRCASRLSGIVIALWHTWPPAVYGRQITIFIYGFSETVSIYCLQWHL